MARHHTIKTKSHYNQIPPMEYYLYINGQVVGPMTAHQLGAYSVNPDTQISTDGGQSWKPLYSFPELMSIYGARANEQVSNKRILCGILAIVLGTLGVQYFVVGKVGAGLLTILLSLITCGAWEIITLIQGILMLTMSDETFEQKYLNPDKWFPLF